MSLESDLLQADRQGEDAPPPAEPETPPAQAAPPDDDAALDKLIEEQSIALPDGEEKLVPLSAVTTLREKLAAAKGELKTAKEGSSKQAELEQTVAQLQQAVGQMRPYVDAYNAALQQAHGQSGIVLDILQGRDDGSRGDAEVPRQLVDVLLHVLPDLVLLLGVALRQDESSKVA